MSKDDHIIPAEKLLLEVSKANLYPKLLAQLQKDLIRAGIDYQIDSNSKPRELVLELQELLFDTLQNAFDEYLNLLYAVDVSETKIRDVGSEKVEDIAAYATYLILKREWKKVWLRHSL